MSSNLLPPAIKKVASIDVGLARELEQSYSRLLMAGDAMVWAQSLLPELLAAQGPSARLEVIVTQARALTDIPQIWAVTWDGDPGTSDVSYSAIAGDGSTAPCPSDISSTILAEVIVNGRPAWADDARADVRFASSESIQSYGLRSIACLPIGQRGALYLHDPEQPGRFDSTTRARLTALCSLAAYFVTTTAGEELIPRAPKVPGMVGTARSMDELSRSIHAFAQIPWPVLILGETGTGKEVVANAVHKLSPLHDGPFVPVNCGAIPSELAESILFGHEEGAFTGAKASKEGLVSRAQGGTLFLDEAGELEPRLQVKLLRLLQEGTYEKVGGSIPMSFTGRIVAATHRPLDTNLGEFREDLYYRLAACVLRIPPLRERLEDVPLLADHLLQRALESLPQAPNLRFSGDTLALLAARPWPGNVRELENSIRVAVAHCMRSTDKELLPIHFPIHGIDTPTEPIKLAVATEQFQKQKVNAALAACNGNRSQAAKMLGVSRQWLHRLLQRWEVGSE